MFYNAKNNAEGRWLEQTGMAVSDDMFHWKRCRDINPILPVGKGAWDSTFASDPVVMYDSREKRWVMFYYGLGNLSACDGVAVSDDLYHWEKYPLPILTIVGERSTAPMPTNRELFFITGCSITFIARVVPIKMVIRQTTMANSGAFPWPEAGRGRKMRKMKWSVEYGSGYLRFDNTL